MTPYYQDEAVCIYHDWVSRSQHDLSDGDESLSSVLAGGGMTTNPELENHPLVQKIAHLTERQQYVLGCICMNVDWGHNQRTLAVLVRLGLIIEKAQSLPFHGGLRMTVKRYEAADLSTHMAYCYWASQQPEAQEASA